MECLECTLARSPRAGARDPVSGHSAWRHPFRVSQAKPHVSPRHPWIASFFISWCKIALIPPIAANLDTTRA